MLLRFLDGDEDLAARAVEALKPLVAEALGLK
jgi:hypothetical protein